MPLKVKALGLVIIAAVIAIVVLVVIPMVQAGSNTGLVISSAQLKEVTNIDKLSTAEVDYEGIAEKLDDNQRPLYYVRYKATVNANVKLSEVDFAVDDEKKTVTPSLPEPSIGDVVLHTAQDDFDLMKVDGFFFVAPDPSLQEQIELCKADAEAEASGNFALVSAAKDNLKKTVESLTKPIIEQAGYKLVWEQGATSANSSSASSSSQENAKAGSSSSSSV